MVIWPLLLDDDNDYFADIGAHEDGLDDYLTIMIPIVVIIQPPYKTFG